MRKIFNKGHQGGNLAKSENVVQNAISAALEVFCSGEDRPQIELFPPYPNQQGSGMRKYCADLVGMLGNSEVILLEIKELDCNTGILPAFDPKQHNDYLQFEKLGVPVAYAYNATQQLSYYNRPREKDWPSITLSQVNRCAPSILPDKRPHLSAHSTLLDWLLSAIGRDSSESLGRISGAFNRASELRNGALVLLYGVSTNTLASLTGDQFAEVISYLKKNPNLMPTHQAKLQAILGAEAAVFNGFVTTHSPRSPSGSSGPSI